MGRIIAITNAKGGVGKTSVAANLAGAAAEAGHRVLAVDFDCQGSLTWHLGVDPEKQRGRTVYEALIRRIPLEQATVHTRHGINLVPANLDLSAAEVDLLLEAEKARDRGKAFAWYEQLRAILVPAREAYDLVLVDCQPSFGALTINALVAADACIVPLACDYLSLRGLEQILATIRKVRAKWNSSLEIAGVLLTMYDGRTVHSREVAAAVRRELTGRVRVFETVIKRSVRFAEAPVAGEPITAYDPGFDGSHAFRQLAREVMTA